MSELPFVSIIIVNYRTSKLIIDCLSSLHKERSIFCCFNVVVVDNSSGDNSIQYLTDEIAKREWNTWVSLLALNKNGGFAYGNNRAIEKILASTQVPDYLWLLNPDTVVHTGACKCLVEFLETHPDVGIAGSRLEDGDGTVLISAFRDHSVMGEFLAGMRLGFLDALCSRWLVAFLSVSTGPYRTDWVSGASMMVRREVFEQVGLLDEEYFMYYEEVDFCLRARKVDWQCWHVPQSRVIHLVGAASGIDTRKKSSRRPSYWFESRRRFF